MNPNVAKPQMHNKTSVSTNTKHVYVFTVINCEIIKIACFLQFQQLLVIISLNCYINPL